MMKRWVLGFALVFMSVVPAVLFAEEMGLHLEPNRISDEVIAEDMETIERLEQRIAALNAGGIPVANYHLSKVTAWMAFARYEYVDNDRTGIVEWALTQADVLVRIMEQGGENISMGTVFMPGSRIVREDLWQKVAIMKGNKDFHCAEGSLAELEVQLVRSSHEMDEMGWRHARPHIRKAEDLAEQAQRQIDACPQAAVFVPPPPPPPPPPPAEPPVVVAILRKLQRLANEVHFALDKAEIHPKTAKVLGEIISVLNAYPVISFDLNGKADHRGSPEYNMALSKRRADALVAYLISGGISKNRMKVDAVGESEAPQSDSSLRDFAKSRQGGFTFYDATGFEPTAQYEDLQIESPAARRHAPPISVVSPAPPAPEKPVLRLPVPRPDELEQNIILQPPD